MVSRLSLRALAPSGAVDGDGTFWSDALNMWVAAAPVIAAANVSFPPTGTISASNVEDALNELDSEKAPKVSPTFTGTVAVPDQAAGDNSGKAANTKYVDAAVAAGGGGGGGTGDLQIPAFQSGSYYTNPFATGSSNTALSVGNLELHPFPVPVACSLDQLAVQVNSAGAAGRLRLGLYDSDSSGLPHSLVIDAGQVTGAATGARTATISQALSAGFYWLAALGEVVGGTWTTWGPSLAAAFLGYAAVGGTSYTRLTTTGVTTGAMPATCPTVVPTTSGTGGLRIFARAA